MTHDVLKALQTLETLPKFYNWMNELSGRPTTSREQEELQRQISTISELGIAGFCEDVALFFYCEYEDVEIVETENHFCFKYGEKYYDSYNREGVEKLKDLEYFKRNPHDSTETFEFCQHELPQLPSYYYAAAKESGLKYASRIYFPH